MAAAVDIGSHEKKGYNLIRVSTLDNLGRLPGLTE